MKLPHKLLPKQYEFVNSTHRHNLFSAGVGAGKTLALVYRALRLALGKPKSVGQLSMWTYPQIRDVLYPKIWEVIGDIPQEYWQWDKSNQNINWYNGSQWRMRHLDVEGKVRGTDLDYYCIDELTVGITPETKRQLDNRLRVDEHGSSNCATNPDSPFHWVYEHFFNNPPPDCLVVQATAYSNHHLPDTYFQDLERMPRSWRDQFVKGLWVAYEGRCYPEFTLLDEMPKPEHVARYWIGLDPGHGEHEFGIVWLAELNDSWFAVVDEAKFKLGVRGMDYVIQVLEEKSEYWGREKFQYACIDWAGHAYRDTIPLHSWINRIYDPAGDSVAKWKRVTNGVVRLEQAFRLGEVKVNPVCMQIQRELHSYVWGKDNEPDKKIFDPHLLDALRYVFIRVSRFEM